MTVSDFDDAKILILAPLGRDADLLHALLSKAGYTPLGENEGWTMPLDQIGAAILTLEALKTPAMEQLRERLAQQPTWSDLPLVLLGEQDLLASSESVRAFSIDRNVTLVGRPVQPPVLISAVKAALRARRRQYETRDLLRRIVAQNLQLEQEVTARRQVEAALQEARDQLAARVEQRTGQLIRTKAALEKEIDQHEATRQQLEAVRRQLHFGREKEWIQLAQMLYDDPLQHLSGILYEIKALRDEKNESERSRRLELVQSQLALVIQHLRGLANERRASIFQEFGLANAMRAYAERFQSRKTPRIAFLLSNDPSPLSEEENWEVYRIYQQALQNAVFHADANAVLVRLQYTAEEVVLEVEDDGKGFEMPPSLLDLVDKGHLGIASMLERAQGIGGHLEIDARPNQGTRIHFSLARQPHSNKQMPLLRKPNKQKKRHFLRAI